jgi:sulfite exporter TauE/SafE
MILHLSAAFVAGVAGSVHCVAMCGGIVGALSLRAHRESAVAARAGAARAAEAPLRVFLHAGCYQAGRVAAYAVLGAIVGAMGAGLATLLDLRGIAVAMRIAAGLVMLSLALRALFGWRLLGGVERFGATVWTRLAPLARRKQVRGLAGSLLLGAVWGFMPCGLVYSMLLFAALAGGAVGGALTMLAFAAGMLPALLTGHLLIAQIGRFTAARALHGIAGMLLFAFGLVTLLGPVWNGAPHALATSLAGWCRAAM